MEALGLKGECRTFGPNPALEEVTLFTFLCRKIWWVIWGKQIVSLLSISN